MELVKNMNGVVFLSGGRCEMEIRNKGFLGQLFCKHDYQWYKKPSDSRFVAISGEKHIRVCHKCGKQDGERFMRYEGSGYK